VFQFVYQGGGNLAECIVFGRIAGMNAAAEVPLDLTQAATNAQKIVSA
jgi:succinate dehydrogenase/fumarate reductase flavoprotein subunit